MSILVHRPTGGVLEKYGPIIIPDGVGIGLVLCGVKCERIGRCTLHAVDWSSAG